MDKNNLHWLAADWPAPSHVRAGTTTRKGGFSRGEYATFNLADHVGDDTDAVRQNRQRLRETLALPEEPAWLGQVHGNTVISLPTGKSNPAADGSYCREAGQVCAVLTADCLPLLLCDSQGREIAAVHVGWRGFCANIIKQALKNFTCQNDEILAWLGPAISVTFYETGAEVYNACHKIVDDADCAFSRTRPGHWLTSLPDLVRLQLGQSGIDRVYGGNHCTYSEPGNFFSYRRDGKTGRNASLIWMEC